MPDVDVVVIGGGISGLTFAHYLRKRGYDTLLVEASTEPGGYIRTIRNGPYVAEGGPQSFTADATFTELVVELGLIDKIQRAQAAAATRYFFVRGKLVAAPDSPNALMRTPLLSLGAKLRLLRELYVRAGGEPNETVARFIERRAGREVLETIATPVISGIFAGDPARLELKSAFPVLAAFEQEHGSILRGATSKLRQSVSPEERPAAVTFDDGNRVLCDALATALGDAFRADSPVERLSIFHGGVEVRCAWPGLAVTASRAVVATAAYVAASLLVDAEPSLAADLRAIDYAPVVQITMVYPLSSIHTAMNGFGFLAPRNAGLRLLGAVWNSAVFMDRAPKDEGLITAFMGGATDREVIDLPDTELAAIADRDLHAAMGIDHVRGRVVAGFRWEKAIPQYIVGHAERVRRIEAALTRLPKIALAGNYLRGISVADCIRNAKNAAQKFAL